MDSEGLSLVVQRENDMAIEFTITVVSYKLPPRDSVSRIPWEVGGCNQMTLVAKDDLVNWLIDECLDCLSAQLLPADYVHVHF